MSVPSQSLQNSADWDQRTPESVTGLDIEVNYVDFRDQSGETTEVGDSAGVKANTGSVSLDRTVYPVPFGVVSDFKNKYMQQLLLKATPTPDQYSQFIRMEWMIHAGLQSGEFLPQGDLIVYVTVTDPDFDVSASGRDSIALDDGTGNSLCYQRLSIRNC